MRKNKDWSISLDEGVTSKKIVEGFFEECGLVPFGCNTLDDYKWNHATDKFFSRGYGMTNKHFTIPSQWQEAKEYICEEEKAKLEVNKWYKFKDKHSCIIGRVTAIGDMYILFKDYIMDNYKGSPEYKEDDKIDRAFDILATELTPKELEEHLIACAKARGFKDGVVIKTVLKQKIRTVKGTVAIRLDELTFNESIESHNKPVIFTFSTNKWAEIVKDELPEINGYKGEFEMGLVEYGCAKFSMGNLRALHGAFQNSTRDIKSIKLDSGVEITMDQINQIIKTYDNR